MKNLRKNLIATLIPLLLVVAGGSCINRYGVGHRFFDTAYGAMDKGTPVFPALNSAGIYSLWQRKGFTGRVVVDASDFFHFVTQESSARFQAMDGVPRNSGDLLTEYEQNISHRNWLWVAMQRGMVRHIYTVLPPETFKERTSRGKSELTEDGVELYSTGLRRTITDRIPELKEPVLLVVDASYFKTPAAASILAEQLRLSHLKVDSITSSLAEDNPDVTMEQRARLLEFVQKYTPWRVKADQ